MALVQTDAGNSNRDLTALDYGKNGVINNTGAEVALVVGSATKAEQFIQDKQYSLLWRDADLLYQSPRPMSVFENTYILEP